MLGNRYTTRLTDYLDLNNKTPHLYHKEEMPHRFETDCQDKAGIVCTLAGLIHPFDVTQIEQHRDRSWLTFIAENTVCQIAISILHEAISIGTTQYQEFEAALTGGFYDSIPRKVTNEGHKETSPSPS